MAGRLYAAILRAAAWLDAHRLLAGVVGLPLVTAAIVAVNRFVLLDFPNSGDEYVYLFQAATLSGGRLWHVPADAASSGIFTTSYVAIETGRMFGTFPFGWPLALALAITAGVPVWLVNPLLGAGTLGLVWLLGTRLYGPRIGVIAAAVVAVSPFFAFNAASYFSHTFCGALLLAAAGVAARDDRRPWWVPVSIGALVGWAVLARYLSGVVGAVPVVWWLLRPGVSRPRSAALVALGGLPWVVALMAYDTAFTGSPWRLTTTPLTLSLWFADGVLLRGADILATHLLRHLTWTPPILVVAYVVYLRTGRREMRKGLLAWLPVLMAAALYFYRERGGNQYGARFHYEIFPFLVLFVVAHVFRAADYAAMPSRDRVMFGLLAASVAAMPVAFAVHALVERDVIRERMSPYVVASAMGLHEALVLIDGRVGSRRSMGAADLTRNTPALDTAVVYGIDPGPDQRCTEAARLPARTPYLFRWDIARRAGAMTPLPCP